VAKYDLRVECYGTLDETNAAIGLAQASAGLAAARRIIAVFDFEVAAMPTWWSGLAVGEPRLRQAHMASVYSFLLKVALLAAIFPDLVAYLIH
jgi:hypothetical protein